MCLTNIVMQLQEIPYGCNSPSQKECLYSLGMLVKFACFNPAHFKGLNGYVYD